MLFNSYVFIFAFLPIVLVVFRILQARADRQGVIAWLVASSFFYYGWWKPEFLILLVISVSANAGFGKLLCRESPPRNVSRKAILVLGLAFNLTLLCYFKYAGFFVENLNWCFNAGFHVPEIILPIGISFITFQKIAFLVDAYRGEVREFRLLDFSLFVTFFPQLIAGPIVHHKEVMPQFAKRHSSGGTNDIAVGLSIFSIGLFKKVVVADSCAVYADAGYSTITAGGALNTASAWIAVIAFSFQLYYDFAGYSDMAVGLARLFGIQFPANFHSPYKAANLIDFWRRWHITLSRFLRDYLYVPLGGNRSGVPRQYLNLTVVMLLGGLWHGARWTFVLWGALHGLGLALNHAWAQHRLSKSPLLATPFFRSAAIFVTFLAVTLAWIPFRSESMAVAHRMFASLWEFDSHGMQSLAQFWQFQFGSFDKVFDLMAWFTPREMWPAPLPADFLVTYRPAGLLLVCVAAATFLFPNSNQIFADFDPVLGMSQKDLVARFSLARLDWKAALALSCAFFISLLQLTRVSPFLYYQF